MTDDRATRPPLAGDSAPPTARLPSLTGMRFLAALLVFVCHAAGSGIVDDDAANTWLAANVTQLGWVGVSFFFVLSGFILTWTARPDDTPRRFWRRRLAKIYPNHLVTWAVGALFLIGAGTATALTVFPSLLLVQAWVPIQEVAFSPNDPSWSLCAELVFYLAFPAVHRRVARIAPDRLWRWFWLTVLAVAVIPVLAQVLPDAPIITYYPDKSWFEYWFVYVLPVSRLPEFVLGMITARIVLGGGLAGLRLVPAVLSLVPGYLLMVLVPDVYALVLPTVVPLALVVAAGARADVAGRRTGFQGRTMVWLGELSFAFYMVHMLVIQQGPLAGGSGTTWTVPQAVGLVAVTLALALGFSWVLMRLVELPAMRRWSRPGRAAVPVQGP